MGFIIGLLSFLMVLDCIVLILLVLIQLPKKEAGAGLAFGAGTTDALFGAGSGTVLTKITKYAATIFFVMAIILSVMQSSFHNRRAAALAAGVGKTSRPAVSATPPAPATTPTPAPSTTGTNVLKIPVEDTNIITLPTNLNNSTSSVPAPTPAQPK